MMLDRQKTIAIIPALNEERTVEQVVRGVKLQVNEVIVVDDGSRDRTGALAEDAGARLIRHEASKGYDASLEDGFREAMLRGADIVITLDADGQHEPRDIPKFIGPLVSDEADVVLGERPRRTHVAEWFFALYTTMRFGVRDPLCGFKAYKRTVYESVGQFDTLNSIGTELALRAVRKGFRVRSVPVGLNSRVDTSRFYAQRIRANLKIVRALMRVILFIR